MPVTTGTFSYANLSTNLSTCLHIMLCIANTFIYTLLCIMRTLFLYLYKHSYMHVYIDIHYVTCMYLSVHSLLHALPYSYIRLQMVSYRLHNYMWRSMHSFVFWFDQRFGMERRNEPIPTLSAVANSTRPHEMLASIIELSAPFCPTHVQLRMQLLRVQLLPRLIRCTLMLRR